MKAPLPSLLALVLGVVLSANTCSGTGAKATNGMANLESGKWSLQTLNGKEPEIPPDMDAPYIAVDSTGHVSGFGGCNRLSGRLHVTADSISFPGLASTKMYCEGRQELEHGFIMALGSATTYTLKGEQLILLARGTEVMVLGREK